MDMDPATGRAFADFPYDIWSLILAYLVHPANRLPRDLLSVSATCHVLRDTVQPLLFRKITFHGPLGSPSNWAGYLQYLYGRFKSNPTLLQHVAECRILGWHAPYSDMSGLQESAASQTERLVSTAFNLMLLMQNLTALYFRSLIVPCSVFQHIRSSNLRTLWMLFCDLRAVDNKTSIQGGTFRALQTLTMHDVWWRSNHFSFDDMLSAPRLRMINVDHSRDFPSPITSCSKTSAASKLHISAPSSLTEEGWDTFFLLFPRLELLDIDWDDDPVTLHPDPHLLSSLNALRCPFAITSSGLVRGRPIKKVWFSYRRERSPEVRVAQALADSLGKTSAVVQELTFTGLTRSDYELILPHFHLRFGHLQKLYLSFSDDSIAQISFSWLTHEYRTLFPRLEQLTIGNALFGLDGSTLVPDATHDQPLVEVWGTACPHLRMITLPGRAYNLADHSWRRTNIPPDLPIFRRF